MAIYKNNNGTWYVMIRYQDWTGARKQKCKRGFATRKEAADWELQFKLQKKASLDMTMESFCALYEEDVRPSLKQSTWLTKENIIQKKILPYLGQRKVSEITAKDLVLNEEEPTYGKYGMLRKQFLKEHRPIRYQNLLLFGKLTAHLNQIDQEVTEQVEVLMKQMAEKQGVNENLKRQDQMKWVGLMNNIKVSAEEIVLKDMVYGQ